MFNNLQNLIVIIKRNIKITIIILILIIIIVAGIWLLLKEIKDSTNGKSQNVNTSKINDELDLLTYCREFNKCGSNATCTFNETAKNYSCYSHSVILQNDSFNLNKTEDNLNKTEGNFLMYTLESSVDSWTFKVPNSSIDHITIIPSTCSTSSSKNSLNDYSIDFLKRKIFLSCPSDNDVDDENDDDDKNKYHIVKAISYNGTGENIYMDNLTGNEIADPTFTIDWISRNIFWVNHNLNTIFVGSLNNNSMKLPLINNISNAKYICVHPGRGKLYWLNDWSQIETANEDGSNRSIFLSGPEIIHATSLIIDFTSDKLCWIGGNNGIKFQCADIEKKIITIIADGLNSMSKIAVSDDSYYWTKNKYQIYYMDKKNSSNSDLFIDTRYNEQVKNTQTIIYSLIFIPENIPPVTNLCQRKNHTNGECSLDELCLPKGQYGVTCRKI